MIRCTSGGVRVSQQRTAVADRAVRPKENGRGRLVAVLGSSRVVVEAGAVRVGAGCPVLKRRSSSPRARRLASEPAARVARRTGPPAERSAPVCRSPSRKVPVVSTTARASTRRPSPRRTPSTAASAVEEVRRPPPRPPSDHAVRAIRCAMMPAVEPLVALRPRSPHRRTARAVEHPELEAGAVRRPSLKSAEGVELDHQVPLADAPHGGVAGHLGHASRRSRVTRATRAPSRAAAAAASHAGVPGPHHHQRHSRAP